MADVARLWQLLELVSRESHHLQGVSARLFGDAEPTVAWLDGVLATPEGIDRLESFAGKFARMQDTMMDCVNGSGIGNAQQISIDDEGGDFDELVGHDLLLKIAGQISEQFFSF
jgi:hypothetical protein